MTEETKLQLAKRIHEQFGAVRIHLVPGRGFVRIPDALQREPVVCLSFGRALPVPVTDLSISLFSISGTLMFSPPYMPRRGDEFWCNIPWTSVCAITSLTGTQGKIYSPGVVLKNMLRVVPGDAAVRTAPTGKLFLVR